ncbi:MAG TPA: metallophosphoesterase [Candidatus Limnocylindria bacterium]|nr:metallophosphoesterase [Candidatus Limnocylindria bacterium]
MKLNRRKFLLQGAVLTPGLIGLDAVAEPGWLSIQKHTLGKGPAVHRFVHFTDVHYKGDESNLSSLVAEINRIKPDFALFTGDLIERARFAPRALELLSGLKMPLYGVPGNHDHWSRADFGQFHQAFAATGGAWMQDQELLLPNGIHLSAMDRLNYRPSTSSGSFRILMVHYPGWTDRIAPSALSSPFDLVLAGHTHGGQVRLPFYGALLTPFDSNGYEMGWYDTPAGRLYVNPGIGTIALNLRFNCRPELAVFEIGSDYQRV